MDIPTTDAEVELKMQDYSPETRRSLLGIYKCYRGMRKTVVDAWEGMLLTHIKIATEQ